MQTEELKSRVLNDVRLFGLNKKGIIQMAEQYVSDHVDLSDNDAFDSFVDCLREKLVSTKDCKELRFIWGGHTYTFTRGTTDGQIRQYKQSLKESLVELNRDYQCFAEPIDGSSVPLSEGKNWIVNHEKKTIKIKPKSYPFVSHYALEALYICIRFQEKFPGYSFVIPGDVLNEHGTLRLKPKTSLSEAWDALIKMGISAGKKAKEATQQQPMLNMNWNDLITDEINARRSQIAAGCILDKISNVPFEIPGYQTEYPHWVNLLRNCFGGPSIMSAPYVGRMLQLRMCPGSKKGEAVENSLTEPIIQDTFEAFESYRYHISTELGDKYSRNYVIDELVRCWKYGVRFGQCLGKDQAEIDMLRSLGSNKVTVLRWLNRLGPVIENNKGISTDLTELQNRMAIVLAFLFRDCQSPEASLDLYEKAVGDWPNTFHIDTGVNLYNSTYQGPIEYNWKQPLHHAIISAKEKIDWARGISPAAYVRAQIKGHGSK